MTNDTMKSLGFLKKSLKMSKRAVEKNSVDDGTTGSMLVSMQLAMEVLQQLVAKWEDTHAASVPVPIPPVIPAGIVQAPPPADAVSTVALPNDPIDPNDDLLTVN